MNKARILLGFAVLSSYALAQTNHACPLTIGIAKTGTVYSSRFNMWTPISIKILESVMQAGCYPDLPDNTYKPITQVMLEIEPDAPSNKVDAVYAILAKKGWPKGRITLKPYVTPKPR